MALQDVMAQSFLDLKGRKIHFIGILGEGMQRLASFCCEAGAQVTGSDLRETPSCRKLQAKGAEVFCGPQLSLPSRPELIVASQAIPDNHAEVVEAHQLGIEVVKYPDFVGRILEETRGIAVSGTHGKSTTTAMVAYILSQAGMDPSYLVGAEVSQLNGGSHRGTGPYTVVEACEYRRSFLYLEPQIGVITCVDFDHPDYFYDFNDVLQAFCDFAEQIHEDGLLLLKANDPSSRAIADAATCEVQTFSGRADADWTAQRIWRAKKRTNFDLYEADKRMGRISMPLYGDHNIDNALAAIAVARKCGVDYDVIRAALDTFDGVDRRLQLIAEPWGIPVLSDYAHHPTEIMATIEATRQRFPAKKRIFCVFQPHQHSRTKTLLHQFATAFNKAHLVVVSDIYAVRDPDDVRRSISSLDLVREVQEYNRLAYYMPDFDDIVDFITGEAVIDDVVLVMGAGNVWQVANTIAERIKNKVRAKRLTAA